MSRMTVGLVNQSATVAPDLVERVAASLQTQVQRDLQPIWNVTADVVALGRVSVVPAGVSPVFIVDQTPHGFSGVHTITQGVPWAMVSTGRNWILAASHEVLELLVDPTGEATRSAPGLRLTADGALQDIDERFDYLLEACDPIEDQDHAYLIGDVLVSDFYTPEYFDDLPRPGARYSHNGALTRPREIGRNGYLSWRDQGGKLRQIRNFAGFSIVDLPDRAGTTSADAKPETSRMFVDRNTPTPRTHPELFGA